MGEGDLNGLAVSSSGISIVLVSEVILSRESDTKCFPKGVAIWLFEGYFTRLLNLSVYSWLGFTSLFGVFWFGY